MKHLAKLALTLTVVVCGLLGSSVVHAASHRHQLPWPVAIHNARFPFRNVTNLSSDYADEFMRGFTIVTPPHSPVYAVKSGEVASVNSADGETYVVLSHHGDLTTSYGHMGSLVVSAGQTVERGQLIGYTDLNWHPINALDAMPRFDFAMHKHGQLVRPLRYLRQ